MSRKKLFLIIFLVLISLFVALYIFLKIQLNLIAINNIIQHSSSADFIKVDDRFNSALWIYYTEDKSIKIEKINFWKLFQKVYCVDSFTKDSDSIVISVARIIITDNNSMNMINWNIQAVDLTLTA